MLLISFVTFRILTVPADSAFNFTLRFALCTFQFRTFESLLFHTHAMRLLDDTCINLTLDAILRVRLYIPADKGHFTLGLFLNIPVDNDIRLCSPYKSQLSCFIFLV